MATAGGNALNMATGVRGRTLLMASRRCPRMVRHDEDKWERCVAQPHQEPRDWKRMTDLPVWRYVTGAIDVKEGDMPCRQPDHLVVVGIVVNTGGPVGIGIC